MLICPACAVPGDVTEPATVAQSIGSQIPSDLKTRVVADRRRPRIPIRLTDAFHHVSSFGSAHPPTIIKIDDHNLRCCASCLHQVE